MEKVDRHPLAPGAAIAETDRSRVYSIVGRKLDDLLNGPGSFYADGVRKDGPTLLADLKRYGADIHDLQDVTDDPSNIIGDVIKHLEDLTDTFEKRLNANEPNDDIALKRENTPSTRDDPIIQIDPEGGPFARPNPISPRNWKPYQDTSLGFAHPSSSGGKIQQTASQSGATNQLVAGTPGQISRQDFFPNFGAARRASYSTLQPMSPQPAPAAQNLTSHVLRMKGVPEADIAAAINDPARMNELLKQLYGHGAVTAPGNDSGGFGGNVGQDTKIDQPDRPSMPTATPGNHPPFGWAGLMALPR